MVLQTVPIDNSFSTITPFKPAEYIIEYDNATQYAFSYLEKNFKSVQANADYSWASMSSEDFKTFLTQVDSHMQQLYADCPDNIDRAEICKLLWTEERLKIIHSGLPATISNGLNGGWAGSLLLTGYRNIVYSKTLPGNGMGLLASKPHAIITVSWICGLGLSAASTFMPFPPAKRLLTTASRFLLLPASIIEIGLNIGVSHTFGRIWPATFDGIAFNATKSIATGPGASIQDFRATREAIDKALREAKRLESMKFLDGKK